MVVQEYLDEGGKSPFARWFGGLDAMAAAKVATALYRLEQGNFSNVEGAGSGIYECKIHFGPEYRIYFSKDGDRLIILLGGGSKKRQSEDIAASSALWRDYKRRKP
ncbi:MAG: type II toxin-antitoxin system RelE/ParE family toxin [Desulfovibrionaceae bacterium]|nr:type II toxin-antitoxin system RelE/ParE family toxin [Desulfovibrionaceae bacterium]MBF0514729.1 type II toxin-antitoxin system RelE/ParE family toxin [Desulfovibrionaceae bacterium]